MKTNDITKAKNPAMRGALNALIRAAAAARKIAIQTDTHHNLQRWQNTTTISGRTPLAGRNERRRAKYKGGSIKEEV